MFYFLVLYSFAANEVNSFEGSLSIIWSNLHDTSLRHLEDLQIIKVYVRLPVFLNLTTGLLQTTSKQVKGSKKELCLINSQRVEVLELKCTSRNLRDKRNNEFLSWRKVHSDSSIELFSLNEMFMVGTWTASNVNIEYIFKANYLII